jgi:hypothetical protein
MTMNFGVAPGWHCSELAERGVELYAPKDGRAHGEIVATIYVCAGHLDQARNPEWIGPVTPWTRPQELVNPQPCGYLVTYVDEIDPDLFPMRLFTDADPVDEEDVTSYKLTVNGRTTQIATLQEVTAAVAEMVTVRLAAEPDRVAEEAQALHDCFRSGLVAETIDGRGVWHTIFDQWGPDQLRITVAKS